MAYFDNAATTYPKPDCVYDYMDRYYRANGASAGRGNYTGAVSASKLIADTRQKIQNVLNCNNKQIIFTPTATIALNIIIQGLLRADNKTVYITPFEHNAITRTLHAFEMKGVIEVIQLEVDDTLQYDLNNIAKQFSSQKPDIVIISHASNVCGLITPVEDIAKIAKGYDATVVVDMAQTAGLVECNVGLETIDYAVFAGHKTLYGPTGVSGFAMKPELELEPVFYGGTGYDSANQEMPVSLPERFEFGTTNIVGIAGLNAALDWLISTGKESIQLKEQENRKRLINLLKGYSFINFVGLNEELKYVGVVSVLIDGISSDSAGSIFDRLGIAVRTGLQCAPVAHRRLGTFPAGTIRFSVSYFTCDKDFEQLETALDYIRDNL